MNELNTCQPRFEHFSNSYQTLRGIRHTPDYRLSTKLHLKMNTASHSFQFTTWACCPIITPCSALLVFHFSTFIHTPKKCHLLLSLTRRADTYMSQVSLCPLESHIGAEECSKCESLNLLVCYYGGCQMDVILSGCRKAPHWMVMKISWQQTRVGGAGLHL